MTRATWLSASLLAVLTIGVFGAGAEPVQPSGKTIGADAQGRPIYQVRTNGIDIGYKLIGTGEPLVMIMGLGGTIEHWPPAVIDALSKRYQLIMPDNRGMGHTTANDTTFTYKLFAADVIGLLDALNVKKAHVLGFSMGSTITQQLLYEYPQRLSKAIIYATSTDGRNVAAALKGKTIDDPTIRRQIAATTHWRTPLKKLPAVTNQVMLLVGTADAVVGVQGSKTLAAAIPGAWLVQFKKGTHPLMNEAPAEFARIVLTFLDIDETIAVK